MMAHVLEISYIYVRPCDTVTCTIPLYMSGYVIQLHALFPFYMSGYVIQLHATIHLYMSGYVIQLHALFYFVHWAMYMSTYIKSTFHLLLISNILVPLLCTDSIMTKI